MDQNNHKTIATWIHLSTFSRFIIPFGNFIGPLLLWVTNKEKSEFIDAHGKQAINFQISLLLYTMIIGLVSIPLLAFGILQGIDFFDFNFDAPIDFNLSTISPLLFIGGSLGFLAVIAFILELVCVITASLKAKEGKLYTYPLNIKFIK